MTSETTFLVVENSQLEANVEPQENFDIKGENSALVKTDYEQPHGLRIPTAVLFITGEVIGGGLVAIASGVVNTGALGIPFLIFAALLNYVSSVLFSSCFLKLIEMYPELRHDSRKSYTNIIKKAIGPKACMITTGIFHFFSLSVTTIYLLISAEMLSLFLKSVLPSLTIVHNYRVWLAVYSIFLYPLTLFGTPKEFWGIALIAVLTTVVSMILISSKILHDSINGIYSEVQYRSVTWKSFFSGVGTILFAFCGVPFFPNIQADMKKQNDFKKASGIGYFVILCVYLPISTISFLILANDTKGDILKNAVRENDTSGSIFLPYLSIMLLSLHFVFAYVLIFNAMAQEIEGMLKIPNQFSWQRCSVRAAIVLTTLILAEAIPNFNVLISVSGGVTQVFLSFVFPFICYWRLNDDIPLWKKIGLVELFLIVVVCGCGSLYSSIDEIIAVYS